MGSCAVQFVSLGGQQPGDLDGLPCRSAGGGRTARASSMAVGYRDFKTRSVIQPNPTNTARLNRSSASIPNASTILCFAFLGSTATDLSCSTSTSAQGL